MAVCGQTISGLYENRTLSFVLEDISKQYDISFAYDSDALESITGTWKFENLNLEQALELLIEPNGLKWKDVSGTIVIYKNDVTTNPNDILGPKKESQIILGEIRDSDTRELLPFAVIVSISGKHLTTTNSDGKFVLSPQMLKDTLVIHYVGYENNVIVPDASVPYLRVLLKSQSIAQATRQFFTNYIR